MEDYMSNNLTIMILEITLLVLSYLAYKIFIISRFNSKYFNNFVTPIKPLVTSETMVTRPLVNTYSPNN
jgi:Na+-transporting methylmalonyl-CoA/oxaloacetate decarboxylase gamma subunit